MEAFSLFAKLTLDSKEFDNDLNGAKSKLSSVGSGLRAVGSKIGSGIATAAKIGVAAVGAATTAVGALTVKSVEAYSEYEQLTGGVAKLYGNMNMTLEEYAKTQGKTSEQVRKDYERNEAAQAEMMKNAQNAYKTAGMSANKYMETATSFSAALIKSLNGDTLKAAQQTDVAMKAISDNWNTFGGDISMVQGAFQGFAKQNYTMLDNLKLGYGGTKEQMQLLIKDANEYAKSIGEASNLSIDSFSDIVTAIELIQKKQQIYGTTAREASTTIQGSLGMVKAAWENLLTGIADGDADLETMMGNLVNSVAGYTDETGQYVNGLIDNIIPVAEKALESISVFIERVFPKLAEEIPKLVTDLFPSLLSAGAQIVSSFTTALVDNLPTLLFTAYDMIETLLNGMLEASQNSSGSTIIEILTQIVGAFAENYMTMIDVGIKILENVIQGIVKGLPELLSYAADVIEYFAKVLVDNLPSLIKTAAELIVTLAEGIAKALPTLIPTIVDVVLTIAEAIIDNLDMIIDAAIDLITALAEGLIEALPKLLEKAPVIIEKLVEAMINNIPKLIVCSGQLIAALVKGIITNLPKMLEAGMKIINEVATGIVRLLFKMDEAGRQAIQKVKDGIKSIDPVQWGKDMIDSFIRGIKDRIAKVRQAATDIAQTVKSVLGFSEPEEGPLSNFHTFAPDMMNLFIKGIRDNTAKLQQQIEKSFDFEDTIVNAAVGGNAETGAAGVGNFNITMNVYGTEGQDVRELADIVSNRLMHQIGQTGAVYA